ncbi:MAG: hypothetical protein ACO3YU_10665 [Candidatus Nanopelagicales bacterium]|jgi:hypothetical protein
MMVVAGILFPESVLQSLWFFYLTAFVAFNTIIFVGLSVAKLLLWPRPAIPADVVPEPDPQAYVRRRRYGRFTRREYEKLSELDPEPGH